MPRLANVQARKGTAAEWASANPTLSAGELGLETDTLKFKAGNGTSPWTTLPYIGAGVAETAVKWNNRALFVSATEPDANSGRANGDIWIKL
jgi:hypothetical protein